MSIKYAIMCDMTTFGTKLKKLRQIQGLSQQKLALEIHYAQSVICDWENGKAEPSASAILAVSNYFNVSCDFLLGKDN